ncbi:MAG: ATP-binding protein [Bacteroidota bacterium]
MSSSAYPQKLMLKQLELDSKPEVIHSVEVFLEEISNELSFKEDVYANVMVAVTEAVNNSILHGNKEDPEKKVFLDVFMENQYRLKITVRDEGEGFNPEGLADPTAPENIENIGGRGVFLMRHLADELSFSDDGRTVIMVFNI